MLTLFSLVPLPPKSMEIVEVELSEEERNVYDYIFTRAKRTFSANVERGTVMKAFTTIFAQILRLRQSCCHPILVRNQDIVAEEELAGAAADKVAGLGDDMDLQSLMNDLLQLPVTRRTQTLLALTFSSKSAMRRLMNVRFAQRNQ